MSPSKRQKAKGAKRPRAWHRGPLEDRRFDDAIAKLDQVLAPADESPPRKEDEDERGQVV